MDGLIEYLLSVTGAAVICSSIIMFAGGSAAGKQLIRLLCGVLMAVTILSPLTDISIHIPADLDGMFSFSAQEYVEEGSASAAEATKAIILEQLQQSIASKAASLNCAPQIEIILSDQQPYTPALIQITGNVSPYAKAQLGHWLKDSLGIPLEAQKWN